MAFIKEEREDMKIEEAFTVKHEDTEEQQTEMMFIIDESGEVIEDTTQQTEMMFIIEETIEVKQEDTEEQTEIKFIKEESEDVKNEDTEEQTGRFHQSFCGMNLFISHIK